MLVFIMQNNPPAHHRRSIRFKNYDYSQPGFYFVTIVVQGRECLFGEIVNGTSVPNNCGTFVLEAWQSLQIRYPNVVPDEFIVMPNHIHGIIEISASSVGAGLALPLINLPDIQRGAATGGAASSAPTLGNIIRAFKSISAIAVNRLLGRSAQPLWQRNYYEHIIRSNREVDQIRFYIRNNPLNWPTDPENT